MKRSTERIIVSHAGSLSRPPQLREMVAAKDTGKPYDQKALDELLRKSVAEVVRKQAECGIDVVNDGELSKVSFSNYARERLGGVELQPVNPAKHRSPIWGRDNQEFAEYFVVRPAFGGQVTTHDIVCTGPLKYIGTAGVQTDIANFKAALQNVKVEEAFLPAVAPGTIEHWLRNEYYKTDADYLEAIANAMHEEYKAIVDAGFILQIDDPDLPDGWQMNPQMDVPAYHKYADLRIEALNHALRDLPIDRIRFHTCWGSYKGPHKYDIPLKDIVDLILKVKAECYSLECSNPVHDADWHVWETVKLPAGKSFMPGVAGHCSDFIESPVLIADRLIQYAKLMGRENVIAGTDCGLGTRVGHPSVAWAKFQAMAEGARLATKQLWNR
jgi:5-methyltetrahydropteroyltriglutamate--homocysteine methyltransferase